MHYLDANKTAEEEARRQLHKNVASNIEQVLAVTPRKAPTIRPTASHHKKLSNLDEPDTQDNAGEPWTNPSMMYSYGPPHMAKQKQDDQPEHTYSSYVRIRDVALKTCQKRWMIGRCGERGSGISVLAARHDDDDDTYFRTPDLEPHHQDSSSDREAFYPTTRDAVSMCWIPLMAFIGI